MAALHTRDPERAAAVLRGGGLVVYPTETFYGLGALLHSAEAVARLAAAKLRPEGKPLPLVAADLAMARAVAAAFPPQAERLAARFWPGPLTLVLAAAPGLPPEVAGDGTVGVRVPGSALARELSRLAGGPLTSTSANLAGGPPVTRPGDLDPGLRSRVDAVLDGGEVPGGLPSTVVALGPGGARLLRAGAVPWEAVLAAAGG
ncbi:MAG TPA: L-threonylcarbamoyladenylate synthase [Anaeromyxobacteraceae bacterium]|nr:L-threonylcarbamoyladenylate synthase [Anaeromyxobacteraceae bacterium]